MQDKLMCSIPTAANRINDRGRSINHLLATLVEKIGIFSLPINSEIGFGKTRSAINIKIAIAKFLVSGFLLFANNPIAANPKIAIPE